MYWEELLSKPWETVQTLHLTAGRDVAGGRPQGADGSVHGNNTLGRLERVYETQGVKNAERINM